MSTDIEPDASRAPAPPAAPVRQQAMTSIRFQLILAALVVSLLVVALFLPFARTRVENGFLAFEANYVAQEKARLRRVLQDRAAQLGRTAMDYSSWDETVAFLAGSNPQWVGDNLTPEVFTNFGVDAIVLADTRLGVVMARSPQGEVPAQLATALLRGAGVCDAAIRARAPTWRFAWMQAKPRIVACAPVQPSDRTGAITGAMAWTLPLNLSRIEELRGLVQFPFDLHEAQPLAEDSYQPERIEAWAQVPDFDGKPGLVAAMHLPRPLGVQRELTTQAMLLLLVAAVCVPSLLMLVFFEAAVVRPLRQVSRWVRGLRREEGTPQQTHFPYERTGFRELGRLARDFAETQDKMRQMSRVYEVLSGINALIVRVGDRDELFQQACRILVDTGHFCKAWIGLIDPQAPPIRILAWAGAEDEYFEDLQRRFDANAAALSGGVLARTLNEGAPVVSNDIANDMQVLERRKLIESGSRSFALFPLTIEGKAVGVISIHSSIVGFFDKEETDLLLGLAQDVSFALDHLMKADRIDHLANHDLLTGLPNRGFFAALLSQRLEAARQENEPLCVALVDLVRFRRINETLGREAGDAVLVQLAARLRDRDSAVARVGPNVFALCIAGLSAATELVREFERIVEHGFARPFRAGGEEVLLGCRIGAAVFPGDGEDAESLLRNAESALHQARTSIESIVFYAPGMNTSVSEALLMESRLRKAIENGEFVLHYQPKYRLADRRIGGVEALIRWQDPEQGLVPPARFIPILEETGLIGPVGNWALRRALEDAHRFRRVRRGLRVSVNVSPLQLNQPNFVEQIAELVLQHGRDALELEITESVIMQDVDRKIAILGELRGLGVTVAVDDFGTGYSSLAYISRLPITSLKIDRTFINRMDEEPQRYSLVSSIVALARPLELNVVAEGVETEAQARLLTLLRCDEAQGFLFSKPVDADRFEEMLAAEARVSSTAATEIPVHLRRQ